MGGPPGIGALVVRRGLRIEPFVVGGEQERARRAGLENVAGATGFGAAAAALTRPGVIEGEESDARTRTGQLAASALAVDGVRLFGDRVDRLPHIVCLGIDGVEAEPVLLGLDQAGVAAHSGSSCSSEALEPSPVLEAMGVDADHSLRLSVGWSTTDADIDAFGAAFAGVVAGLRALRS
jgi:cysteine desulfurase